MHPTRVHAQTGTEKWVRWAQNEALSMLGFLKRWNVARLQRTYRPDASTLVWIRVTPWASIIRITGSSNGYRGWAAVYYDEGTTSVETGDLAVEFGASGSVTTVKTGHARADFSVDYVAIAEDGGTTVVVNRDSHTTTLASHAPLPQFEFGGSYYAAAYGALSPDGAYYVAVPSTQTPDHIATALRWNSDTGEYDQITVPLPPDLPLIGTYTTVEDVDDPLQTGIHPLEDTSVVGFAKFWYNVDVALKNNVDTRQATVHAMVVRPRRQGSKVFVKTIAPESYSVNVQVPSNPSNGHAYGVLTLVFTTKVWSFDIATEEWVLEYEQEYVNGQDFSEEFFEDLTTGGVAWLGAYSVPASAFLLPLYSGDTLSKVRFDDLVVTLNPTVTTLYGVVGLSVRSNTVDTNDTELSVYVNDVLQLSGVVVDTSALVTAGDFRELHLRGLGDGVVAVGRINGSTPQSLYWKHASGTSTVSGIGDALVSLSCNWAAVGEDLYYRGTSVGTVTSLYDSGGTNELVMFSQTADNEALVQSATVDVELFGGTSSSTISQLVYGGLVDTGFFGSYTVSEAAQTGVTGSPGSYVQWEVSGGVLSSSPLPPFVTFTPDGSSYTLTGTDGGGGDPPVVETITPLDVVTLAESSGTYTVTFDRQCPYTFADSDIVYAIDSTSEVRVVPSTFVVR